MLIEESVCVSKNNLIKLIELLVESIFYVTLAVLGPYNCGIQL